MLSNYLSKVEPSFKKYTTTLPKELYKSISTFFFKLITARSVIYSFFFIYRLFIKSLGFPVIANIFAVIFNVFSIWKNYFIENIILFVISIPLYLLSVNLFFNKPDIYIFYIYPYLFFNLFFILVFYCHTNRHENNKLLPSLLSAFNICLSKIIYLLQTFILHLSILVESLLIFLVYSLFISSIFTSLSIPWQQSFYFWAIIIFSALILSLIIYILNIVFLQTYFIVVLDNQNPFQAVINSSSIVRKKLSVFLSYNFVLTVAFGLLIYFGTFTFFDTGFSIALFFYYYFVILFGYILRKVYVLNNNTHIPTIKPSRLLKYILTAIFILGIPCIIFLNILTLNLYPNIIDIINQEQIVIETTQEFITYRKNGFSIDYPKSWTAYTWNNNSVTLYKNYNSSANNGIWVSINVSSLYDTDYNDLFYKQPGIVMYDPDTKSFTTKVSNLSLQGHDAIKYTYIKQNHSNTEYQTHYLIRNGFKVFDVIFITNSKSIENKYSKLFDIMIASFRFTD